jgi:hypothetical protein
MSDVASAATRGAPNMTTAFYNVSDNIAERADSGPC